MIEICTVSGYNEVGKNCTAIKIDEEVIILDMGLDLESYIKYTEEEDIIKINSEELIKRGAIPDISIIKEWTNKVKAIIPTHAHLDHVGALPYLANRFRAPIICTPFTTAVVKAILKDEKIKLKNKIKTLTPNSSYKVSNKIKVEFIHVTHSTPQTVMVALHIKEGIILYANDFKFDRYPTFGKKPNFKRLKEIGENNVLMLIVDSTYADEAKKMPSESVAKQMLKDVLMGTNNKEKAIIVTTFSSHIARLKSIIELGKKLDRKIVFLGRSLSKYVKAAESVNIINFTKDIELIAYSNKIKKRLREIEKNKAKYLLVVTGHQGEPKSTLAKIAKQEISFKFDPEDHVIFSCRVIPTPTNIKNRETLENNLKSYHVRIFRDIHQSGHAAREDLRDLINLIKPKHIIPAHGNIKMTSALSTLAEEMGYKKGINVHLMRNSQKLLVKP